MKKEIAINRMLKVIMILTIVLIFMQYYFYRVRENNVREANEAYVAQQALLEQEL